MNHFRGALAAFIARGRTAAARIVDGARLVAHRRRVAPERLAPAIERPSVVLATGLVLALIAIPLLDPLMRFEPRVVDGSLADRILTFGTSFGEGVELLVGSGVLFLLLAAIDPAGLTRAVRARLFEAAATFGFVFASVAGSGIVASLFKNLYGRARPEHLVGDAVFQVHFAAFSSQWAAFPSGHATTAGASAAVLALLFPRWRGPVVAAGVAIAITRIALGAHFPSDVVAGFAFGAGFTLMLAHALAGRGVVFGRDGDGRLVTRPAAGPAGWFDLLADLLAARRGSAQA